MEIKEWHERTRNAAQGNPPDLRINTVAGLVVGCEYLRTEAAGEVVLNARLLASNESRHDGHPMSMSMSMRISRGARSWVRSSAESSSPAGMKLID